MRGFKTSNTEKISILSCFIIGNSPKELTPKQRKNSSVVANKIGLPGASNLPASRADKEVSNEAALSLRFRRSGH